MKRKLLLCLGLALTVNLAKSQWANQASTWDYGFSSGTSGTYSNTTTATENTSSSAIPFLPIPPSGTSRVALVANSGGTFVLNATNNTLTLTGATAAASKFSAYNILGASEIASVSFEAIFSNPGSQAPTYYFSMGTRAAAGNLYNNNNAVYTGANSGGALFNALRFLFSASNVTLGHRTSGDSNGYYGTLSGGNLAFNTSYKFELYMNNSAVSKSYTRGATYYSVASKSYQLWVTNISAGTSVRYAYASSFDLPRPTETNTVTSTNATILEGAPLNSFLFQSINLTGNTSSLQLKGDIKVAYDETTLPVSLTSFTGKKLSNGIELNWVTASEQHNDYFELFRAADGKNYISLGKITGKGNSNELTNYVFTDRNPIAGYNYYQLKQVDKDGTVNTIEQKVALKYDLGKDEPFTVSSTESKLNVSISAASAIQADFYVFDINGKRLTQTKLNLNAGKNTYSVDATNLPKGVLIARVSTINGVQNMKFLR